MIALIPGYMAHGHDDAVTIYCGDHVAHDPNGHPLRFGLGVNYDTLLEAAKDHERYLDGLHRSMGILLERKRWLPDAEVGS